MVDLSQYYVPHSGQELIHASKAKEKYLEIARRWGKSRAAFGELLQAYIDWTELFIAGKRDKFLEPAFHAWIVVPNFPQGRQTWNEILRFMPKEFIQNIDRQNQTIDLRGPNNAHGFLEVKSAHDPDGLQTVGLDYLWVQEAQDVSNAAIEKLRPVLQSKGRMQRAVFEGIPSLWADHWFRRGCVAKMRTTEPRRVRAYFNFTVYDNPMLSDQDIKEIEADRDILTEAAWRRMYLAEFSQNAGFFRNIDNCIAGDLLTVPLDGVEYIAGIDLGISNDPTIVIVMDAVNRKIVYHAMYDSMPWPDQKEGIRYISDTWNLTRIQVDATSMQMAMAQELQEMGLPIEVDSQDRPGTQIVGETRKTLLGTLAVAIERASVQFPSIDPLLRQLRAFQWISINTANGRRMKAQAPAGEHDDEVFALALALSICEPPTPNEQPNKVKLSSRYVPTQAEASGNSIGVRSEFVKMRRLERWQKMEEAAERAGLRNY